jgi:hypothetical protein
VLLALSLPVGARPREVREQSDQEHAQRLCTSYARDHGLEVGTGFTWNAVTAGELKVLANQVKIDVSPWDTFPSSHFIARCSFIRVRDLSTSSPTTPTTRCPDGSVVVLQAPGANTDVLVDDSGRTSSDPFAQLPSRLGSLDVCASFSRR